MNDRLLEHEGKQNVEVTILGQRLLLKGTSDPERVERLVRHVQSKIDAMGATGPVNGTKLAVLAALNIADDYFRAVEEGHAFRAEVVSRSEDLLKELEDHGGA